MKYRLIILLSFLFGFSSCSYYVYPPKVESRTEKKYVYKLNKNYVRSKCQKKSIKVGYERFDKKGNIIERGVYGETKDFINVTKYTDGSIRSIRGHSRNYKNLNTVCYSQFDSVNKKTADELWSFKGNKKDYLIHKTFFEYDSIGKLVKEIEYDKHNKISKLREYFISGENEVVAKNIFYSHFESIRQDTIVTDSLGRPIEEVYYLNDKFLYRKEFRYDHFDQITTELIYYDKSDNLFSITEWQYDSNKQPMRRFWKVIGSRSERKDIYFYNRKMLIKKIMHYRGEELESYTKFKYKLL